MRRNVDTFQRRRRRGSPRRAVQRCRSGCFPRSRIVGAIRDASFIKAIQPQWYMVGDQLGSHVLVANASTIDPADATHNYAGTTTDPVSLRVHRLAHMLVGVSHEEGISIIDIDRVIAELGATGNVEAAMSYGPAACAAIADELVRVLEDYGFFDERTLVAQVGAKRK